MHSGRRLARYALLAVALLAPTRLLAAGADDGRTPECARLLANPTAREAAGSAIVQAWLELMSHLPSAAAEPFMTRGMRLNDPASRALFWLSPGPAQSLPTEVRDALAQLDALSVATAESLGVSLEDWWRELGSALTDGIRAEARLSPELASAVMEAREEIPVDILRKSGPLGRRPRAAPLPKRRSIHVDFRGRRIDVFNEHGEILHQHELPASFARPNEPVPIDWTALRTRDGGALLFFTKRECALRLGPTGELRGSLCDARITQPHHAIALSDARVAVWDTERDELLVIDPDRIGGPDTAIVARASTSGFHAGITGTLFKLIARPDGSAWFARIDGEILAVSPDGSSRRLPPVPVPHQNWPVSLGGWSTIGVQALPSGRIAWVTPTNDLMVLSPEGTRLWTRRYPMTLRSLLELKDESLIVGDERSVIEKISPQGTRLWFKQLPNSRAAAAPVILHDGRIAVSVPDDLPNASSLWILNPQSGIPLGDPIPLALPGARAPLLLTSGDLLLISDADSALTPGEVLVLSGSDPTQVVFGPIELELSQTASAIELEDGRILVTSNGESLWLNPSAASQLAH